MKKAKKPQRKPSTMERETEHRKLALGFRFGITEEGDGSYRWYVKQWQKMVAGGVKSSRKEADRAMQEALGGIVAAASRISGDRGRLRTKLISLVQKRPYVASWVFDTLSHLPSAARGEITHRAKEEEGVRWTRDEGAGKAPLSTHHLTKPAAEVAGLMWDLCQQLGLVGPKAWRFASNLLGRGFTDPDDESTEDLPPEKDSKDAPEAFTEDENAMIRDSPV